MITKIPCRNFTYSIDHLHLAGNDKSGMPESSIEKKGCLFMIGNLFEMAYA